MSKSHGLIARRERTIWVLMLLPGISFCVAGYLRLSAELQQLTHRIAWTLLTMITPW